jgi:hypothetical protein
MNKLTLISDERTISNDSVWRLFGQLLPRIESLPDTVISSQHANSKDNVRNETMALEM